MIEPDFVTATRTAYDTVAASYAEQLRDHLAGEPFDRAMLDAFTSLVGTGAGPVVEVGCGPGRITGYLHDHGLDISGVDLSPRMIEVARAAHPAIRFTVGTMTALDVPDGALAGLVAWYSIIHTPPELLPGVFAEFRRALRHDGRLLLAFQAGDEVVHVQHAYGHDIDAHAYRLPPDHIAELLADAGFAVEARLVRAGRPPLEKTPQAYLLARVQR
ncbi:class I SAM-dependent DNA methyltransferase [Jiangella rhizosphaerae]|uniref:Class I SAM-dependent methyltransferase n=1 Tax=Jiangella rhizosphaerae TaxID=2293569 RepID=A0A418KTZ8_9ACTN|nr:class I SAM-dependent methyltransferase [Jiangella rhizosphaerae]RIQ29584.1 class I SAM-dependent methyltransferase [Jiangella rhizosphaerae]